ncbi:MAG: S9 family peptidase [Chitinophagaceae bacterium]|nr:S9 family peptidase [Chitinophagaceae bacterium]
MKRCLLLLTFFVMTFSIRAQKKPLDHSVYDSWQHVGEKLISNDGQWVVYTVDPQLGDNELVVETSGGLNRKSFPRGYNAFITDDSRFLIFKIKPYNKDVREAKIQKKKAADMPKDSLAIIELGKETIWKTPGVKSYKTPSQGANWVAYQIEKSKEAITKTKTADGKGSRVADSLSRVIDSLNLIIEANAEKKTKTKKKDSEEYDELANLYGTSDADGDDAAGAGAEQASDLVVKNVETQGEIVFYSVLEYYFNKTGEKLLIYQAKNPRDSTSKKMVVLYDLKEGKTIELSKGGNDFKNFAITEDGSQVAYVAEREAKPNDLQKFYKLWFYRQGADSAVMLADRYMQGMKLGTTVSEYGTVSFSKSGQRIFFGSAPVLSPKDTTLVDFENAKLDIWHYNDDYLQTVQTFPSKLKADLQQSYLTVYDLPTNTIRLLGSKEIPQVIQTVEGDGDTFIGVTDYGKRIESQWTGNTRKNIYAIDVNTGEKKLVKENLIGQVYPSAAGKYILWYDRVIKNYFAWDGAVTRNITSDVKVPLYQEDWDTPDEPAQYGVMGWVQGDSAVYIYDRYDVWKLDPLKVQAPVNLTKAGRILKDVYRYVRLDREEKFMKGNADLYFKTLNRDSKKSAYWIFPGDGGEKQSMTGIQDCKFENLQKARKADVYIATKETFSQPADLFRLSFRETSPQQVRLSSINPQQANYNWGTAELFKWKAYNGKDATGMVFKPEDFDPKKKYPMIVYFYEKLSDELHTYREPAPIRSAVNVPFFVSRGYIIFMPDIEYKTGHPGQGAYDYIVSGARALVKKGFVDSTNMALQGHSWGGYQAAIVATMTPMFKAIWAGAPVSNMTSAYGGIRWESGVSRQFQYEKTQSRIGGTLWEKLPLYLENSPLFHLDKVTAPMVIMANDADGAVPWYQGIELFIGLRRLGKKAWMFNYNGQGHGLTQRQDMRDYQIRMQQFFDWILKGDRPTHWITDGVPAVNKGKDWGLE